MRDVDLAADKPAGPRKPARVIPHLGVAMGPLQSHVAQDLIPEPLMAMHGSLPQFRQRAEPARAHEPRDVRIARPRMILGPPDEIGGVQGVLINETKVSRTRNR